MPEHFLSSPFLYSLALTIIHFIWQGLLVAVVLKSILVFIPNHKPQLRYALSAFAMLCHLIIPIITFYIIYQPDQLPLLLNLQISDTQQVIPSVNAINNSLWSQELAEYLPYLSITWLAVISVLASKIFVEIYSVNQLTTRSAKPAIGALQARFNELVAKLSITSSPKLLISLKVSVPMAIGWLKPVVLLPAAMVSGLTPAQLDMLILHELAHIRRHDYFVNFVQTLVETLLFFHPAVLWVSNQMRNEREYCSDDIAIEHSGDRIAYAHTLVDTASLHRNICKGRDHSVPSMAMAASGGDLKQRVTRLVEQHHCQSNNDFGKWLASIVIILSVMMFSLKQFVISPFVDVNAGAFSLYKAAKIFPSIPVKITELSETSVAKQLLTNTLVNKNRTRFSARTSSKKTLMVRFSAELVEDNQFKAFPDSAKKYTDTAQKTELNLPQNHIEQIQDDVNVLELRAKAILPITKFNKSISELAFERTDSNNVNAVINNPYSDQVKALAEPLKTSLEDNVNKQVSPAELASSLEQTDAIVVNHEAKLISSVEPRYPTTAKRKGIELDMMVHFTISTAGRVKDIQFEFKSKASYFRSAIRNAMDKWRFIPANIDGKAVESEMSKNFSFSLTQ